MSVDPCLGGVELQVRRTALARPCLRRVEQSFPETMRALLRVDSQVLDPGAMAEAHGVELVVDRDEAGYAPVHVCHEDLLAVVANRLQQPLGRRRWIPHRRLRARWCEQPVVSGDYLVDLVRPGGANVHAASLTQISADEAGARA